VKHEHIETCRTHKKDVIIYGEASWSKKSDPKYSVKYGWYDKLGRITRGGEIPIEAIPQMLEVAVIQGGLKLSEPTP
jgi:hypothetical protein